MRALDDLVTAGKIRYIGFSDTPAWKVAEAQVTAHFRDWNPIVALQIEYSLMQRTVEGELIPMAKELGLGVIPWSPLSSGTLSGKYTRENGNQLSGARAAFSPRLSDKQYDIIESVGQVAKERGVAHATVALSWLKSRAGVSSVLLGVTSIAQLDENLKGIDLTLTEAEIARLDAVSVPALNFPAASLNASPSISHAGAMVNGVATQKMVFVPNDGDKRW